MEVPCPAHHEVELSYLKIEGVTKSFGPFKALDGVDLSVGKGSIHAVLGENGAGKTTLMNVLYGLYRPDSGTISVNGSAISLGSPRDAIRHRIGMIHQHFQLANALTVVENIALGLGGGPRLNLAEHAKRIVAMSAEYGFDVEPSSPVWKLPIGMRQRVEILKALYREAEILVLDEPTSVLAPDEIDSFLSGLKRMRELGHTILFITHKLDEVMAVADRASVMRRGKVISEVDADDTTAKELSRIMVGREFAVPQRQPTAPGAEVLVLDGVSANNDRDAPALRQVSLSLRAGEVLGISGVDGNGQAELAQVIAGLRPTTSGDIRIDGASISAFSVRDRIVESRIGYVPEDRHSTGLVLDYPVGENLILRDFDRPPVSPRGIIDRRMQRDRAVDLVQRYDIRLPHHDEPVRMLSGGNQQKVILARELNAAPRVLIIAQATKGLDVGAIAFVQSKILEERARGMAVLYISTELEHLMEVADRVGIMCAGRLSPILSPEDVTTQCVGQFMAGIFEEVA